MNRLRFLALAGICGVFWVAGCDDCVDCHWKPDPVVSITIQIGTDTLRFLPGDSASTTVTIIASDWSGNVVAGEHVRVSLSHPELGFLEFLDPWLRDTTNEQGRVSLLFTAIGRSGDQVITVCVDDHCRSVGIAIREMPLNVGMLDISLAWIEYVALPGQEVMALHVIVIAETPEQEPLVDVNLPISTSGGRFDPLPATNDSGIARTRWHLMDGDSLTAWWIAVHGGGVYDTAWCCPPWPPTN